MPPAASRTGPPVVKGVPPSSNSFISLPKRGTVQRRIEHAAVLLGQADPLDPQRLGEHLLGQLEGDPAHAERLAGDGLDVDPPLGH